MKFIKSELDQLQNDLKSEGCDISTLRRFGESLPRISDQSLEEAFVQFHNWAGRLPYWRDYDVGALVLEHVADSMASSKRRTDVYRHAVYRARWCAATATAGGEGIARSKHIQQLERKLNAEADI